MKAYMIQCVDQIPGDQLSVEQRNLISVGYKNLMSARRTAWRVVDQELNQKMSKLSGSEGITEEETRKGKEYQAKIAAEVKDLITEVEEKVVTKSPKSEGFAATEDEVLVFFHKMQGDYNRYGAEITEGEDREGFATKAKEAYDMASERANNLPTTNPIRLGLALNYSVFQYEILNEKQVANSLARDAFDSSIKHIDALEEDQYRDSTLIMQLLKDNLELWGQGDDEVEDVA